MSLSLLLGRIETFITWFVGCMACCWAPYHYEGDKVSLFTCIIILTFSQSHRKIRQSKTFSNTLRSKKGLVLLKSNFL